MCSVGFRPQEVFACIYAFPIAIMVTEVISFLGFFDSFWGGCYSTLELFGWGMGVSVK